MCNITNEAEEKKVEYIELIYDLIFVYIIGRNNSLLHSFSGGFVTPAAFMAYVMTTLAAIQIWTYSTYYINIFGRHGIRDHVFLFINMFLLYFVGEGTRTNWQGYHAQYHVSWALILINIGVQYLIELGNRKNEEQNRIHIIRMAMILFLEAAIVLADIPVFRASGTTWLSFAGIIFGMCAVLTVGQRDSEELVDFPHLSERAMLYVVFTFGEMIIVIASYFEGVFSLRSTYFALMAFLIVVGLFLSYGIFYDHIIDREKKTSGRGYMTLHVFIIFAMNNITNGLEFMQEEKISLMPKILFLICSFVLFFGFIFVMGYRYAKTRCFDYNRLCLRAAGTGAVFVALMLLLRNEMMANIALTVVFVFGMFAMICRYGKRIEQSD